MSAYWLNEDSRTFLSRGYLPEGMSAEQRIEQIGQAAQGYLGMDGFARKFEEYMHNGWISLASPVWANFGTERGLPISCNGTHISDTIPDILIKTAEIGMMTKQGAGTSAYLGDLRARGAIVSGGGSSSGPLHFAELIQSTTSVISQSSVRRGHCAIYLPIDHPDIGELLACREEGHPIQHLSLGVCVSDAWLEAMLGGDKEKRTLWLRVIRKRFETGYPYIFFTDNANRGAPACYREQGYQIRASQMCVAGHTPVLTRDGWVLIEAVAGTDQEIWNGEKFSRSHVAQTGSCQDLVRVALDNETELDVTPYHRFFVVTGVNSKPVEKLAHQLEVGDKLIKFDLPLIERPSAGYPNPYVSGFFSGDGTYASGRPLIWLYGSKNDLHDVLAVPGSRSKQATDHTGRGSIYLPPDAVMPKFAVPNGSVSERISWLAGLLDADGTVARNGDNQALQIASVDLDFLRNTRLMLQTLGIESRIGFVRPERDTEMPDGHGGKASYRCRALYRLVIAHNQVQTLIILGLNTRRLRLDVLPCVRSALQFVRVRSVDALPGSHDTYCFHEPERGMGMFNGVLAGNCTEIMLPATQEESFVCDLSSLNALHYADWKDTDLVETTTQFLDAVMEEYIRKTERMPLMEAPHRFAKRHRALGLGTLGWHSYLQSKMISFESEDASRLNVQVHRVMDERSLDASRDMAKAYGEPEVCLGYGVRNTTRMAIAPTTSSSFILGQVSPSIEPLDSNYFVKDLQKGRFTYRNPYLDVLLTEKGLNTGAVWDSILTRGGSVQHLDGLTDHEKSVFKTFDQIDQGVVIQQAIDRQPFIDQGQSLNLKIHPDAPVKQVNDLMLKAWRGGLKSLYYQRSTNLAQEYVRSLVSCQSCEA